MREGDEHTWSGAAIMSSSSTAVMRRSEKAHKYPLDSTGSSGSMPRKMYMRVFSMMASSCGSSLLHCMPHASLRSIARCSPRPPSARRSTSDRMPLMSITDMRDASAFSASTWVWGFGGLGCWR